MTSCSTSRGRVERGSSSTPPRTTRPPGRSTVAVDVGLPELEPSAAFGGGPARSVWPVNSAAARSILRPSLQGAGRDRWR